MSWILFTIYTMGVLAAGFTFGLAYATTALLKRHH